MHGPQDDIRTTLRNAYVWKLVWSIAHRQYEVPGCEAPGEINRRNYLGPTSHRERPADRVGGAWVPGRGQPRHRPSRLSAEGIPHRAASASPRTERAMPDRLGNAPVLSSKSWLPKAPWQVQRRRRVRLVLAAFARFAAKRTPPGLSPTSTRTTVESGSTSPSPTCSTEVSSTPSLLSAARAP